MRRGKGLLELLLTPVPAARALAHASPERLPSSSATRRPRAPSGAHTQAREASCKNRRFASRGRKKEHFQKNLPPFRPFTHGTTARHDGGLVLSRPRELCPGGDRLGPRTAHEVRAVELELRACGCVAEGKGVLPWRSGVFTYVLTYSILAYS